MLTSLFQKRICILKYTALFFNDYVLQCTTDLFYSKKLLFLLYIVDKTGIRFARHYNYA